MIMNNRELVTERNFCMVLVALIYKNNYEYSEKIFDTNSKEELKIWMDLIGYNLLRNFLIKNHRGDKLEIKYAMIELSKVS